MRREPDDVVLDALALVEASHAGDWEGARVILRHTEPPMVMGFLARLAADLIESLLEDDPDAFKRLREHYTAG